MAINPIDLQTLFSHINQVGKEQAHIKEATVLQQSSAGNEIVKDSEERDHSVNETESSDEGASAVKDQNGSRERNESEKRKKEEDSEDKPSRKTFQDPNLGKNIDLSG